MKPLTLENAHEVRIDGGIFIENLTISPTVFEHVTIKGPDGNLDGIHIEHLSIHPRREIFADRVKEGLDLRSHGGALRVAPSQKVTRPLGWSDQLPGTGRSELTASDAEARGAGNLNRASLKQAIVKLVSIKQYGLILKRLVSKFHTSVLLWLRK